MGPTASGKTELAFALADCLPLEIVSVDSALVYRGMDIGTAKPSIDERERYPHHLVDILDPAQPYSVAEFRRDALAAMNSICQAGKVPLLVGGTMMYFRALQQGLAKLPEADMQIRQHLQRRLAEEGLAVLHAELAQIDSAAAQRIHATDPQRTLRALEVYAASGQTMSELIAADIPDALPYRLLKFALLPDDRKLLHTRIATRFDVMLKKGFIKEVSALRSRTDLDLDTPSMRAVGYRQVWQYLDGRWDFAQMQERAVIATRQLAKRQHTWLRSESELIYLDMLNPQLNMVSEQIDRFLLS